MSNLIYAEFSRLFHSFIFRLALLFSAGFSVFVVLTRFVDIQKNATVYAALDPSYSNVDGLLFAGGLYIVFAASVFLGIFVGTEYSDGTLRNKILIGHSRFSVYLSKLIVCTLADILLHLVYLALTLILGWLLLHGTAIPTEEILKFSVLGILTFAALSALLLMISMLIPSKAAGSITGLILTVAMFFTMLVVNDILRAPEYYEGYTYENTDTGETITVESRKNTNYPTGLMRKVYECINDVLPVSQLYQICTQDDSHAKQMAGYDLVLFLATTGIGIFAFERKDLK